MRQCASRAPPTNGGTRPVKLRGFTLDGVGGETLALPGPTLGAAVRRSLTTVDDRRRQQLPRVGIPGRPRQSAPTRGRRPSDAVATSSQGAQVRPRRPPPAASPRPRSPFPLVEVRKRFAVVRRLDGQWQAALPERGSDPERRLLLVADDGRADPGESPRCRTTPGAGAVPMRSKFRRQAGASTSTWALPAASVSRRS